MASILAARKQAQYDGGIVQWSVDAKEGDGCRHDQE